MLPGPDTWRCCGRYVSRSWSVVSVGARLDSSLMCSAQVSARRDYALMLMDTPYAHCWWCGREPEDRPEKWGGSWLVERCHIASIPRVLDRRLVVLMCSRCHDAQHGEWFDRSLATKPPTLATMLWLKATFDPEYYSRSFIQRFHIGKMPEKRMPPASVQTAYVNRRGAYPGKE